MGRDVLYRPFVKVMAGGFPASDGVGGFMVVADDRRHDGVIRTCSSVAGLPGLVERCMELPVVRGEDGSYV